MESTPVAGYPDWTQGRQSADESPTGKARVLYTYLPTGEQVSASTFKRMRTEAGQEPLSAPREAITPSPAEAEWKLSDVPEPTQKIKPGQLASAEELSFSILLTLLVLTSLTAFLLRASELRLEQEEASEIAQPLGRILARSKLNTRYGPILRNSGDYSLLGYALYRYGERVAGTLRDRQDLSRNNAAVREINQRINYATAQPQQSPTGSIAGSPETSGQPGGLNGRRAGLPVTDQTASPGWYSPIPKNP